MSQDIVADALNNIMNVKRAGKEEVTIARTSKFLISVLELAKKNDYLDYNVEGRKINVKIKNLNECRAIKPRFYINEKNIDKYLKRFLPSRRLGVLFISTNEGLITHHEAIERNIGGSLIAYFY